MKAIIFDVDGVLFHSEPLHRKAWLHTLRSYGYQFSEQDLMKWTGIPCRTMSMQLAETLEPPRPWQDLYNRKEATYKELVQQDPPFHSELEDILRNLAETYTLAYATSTLREMTELLFRLAGITDVFSDGVTLEDVEHPKPHPETYERTREKLGLPAEECWVIEDSVAGVAAAKAAGMVTIGVTTTFSQAELDAADYLFDTTQDACRWLLDT